jgi:hypothetical protein
MHFRIECRERSVGVELECLVGFRTAGLLQLRGVQRVEFLDQDLVKAYSGFAHAGLP